jgi:MFS family permease
MLVFGATAFIPTHLHLNRGADLAIAGLALVPYAAGGAIFAIFASKFVRALGEVRLAQVGVILLMTGILSVAWSPHIAVAARGCLLAGLGFYMLHNTLQTNATQMAPARRGVAVALFASCFFIGQSVGVGISGLLVERVGSTPVLVTRTHARSDGLVEEIRRGPGGIRDLDHGTAGADRGAPRPQRRRENDDGIDDRRPHRAR